MAKEEECNKCNGTGAIGAHPAIALIEKNRKHMCKACKGYGYNLKTGRILKMKCSRCGNYTEDDKLCPSCKDNDRESQG